MNISEVLLIASTEPKNTYIRRQPGCTKRWKQSSDSEHLSETLVRAVKSALAQPKMKWNAKDSKDAKDETDLQLLWDGSQLTLDTFRSSLYIFPQDFLAVHEEEALKSSSFTICSWTVRHITARICALLLYLRLLQKAKTSTFKNYWHLMWHLLVSASFDIIFLQSP